MPAARPEAIIHALMDIQEKIRVTESVAKDVRFKEGQLALQERRAGDPDRQIVAA